MVHIPWTSGVSLSGSIGGEVPLPRIEQAIGRYCRFEPDSRELRLPPSPGMSELIQRLGGKDIPRLDDVQIVPESEVGTRFVGHGSSPSRKVLLSERVVQRALGCDRDPRTTFARAEVVHEITHALGRVHLIADKGHGGLRVHRSGYVVLPPAEGKPTILGRLLDE